LAAFACSRQAHAADASRSAAATINAADLMRHIQVLASDAFEGRAPASKGEELTVDYLIKQFQALGLKPGNPDGTFIQKVPMVGYKSDAQVAFASGQSRTNLQHPQDYVAWSSLYKPEVKVTDSELVFVGYGVVAPEYGWDDYKGVDVRGKTLVMLVNDPPVPDASDPSKLDDKMFKGKAMTYYGRWTYKYEIAREKGAAAALVIHETGPAGYPYFVVINSWGTENFDLKHRDQEPIAVAGWLSLDRARATFAAAGKDFEAMKQSALNKNFKAVPLGIRADFTVRNTLREVESKNVIAKIDGADPALKNHYVIYTAHWDHLGRNSKLSGDQIFNGAADNATGTAALLEIAEAFTKLRHGPKATTLFAAVTAEEQGLLGAKYYATHPLYPLERTLANINMDNMGTFGPTRDINVVGIGQNTLEDALREVAAARNRVVLPESQPEKGYYYRSDHFEFAKQGVPALYLKMGDDVIGKPPGWGKQRLDEYTDKDYHKVSDEIKPDWDLRGCAEDAQLLFEVGWRVAEGLHKPDWKFGSEFKARRDEMLKQKP
jgi:Zn-dependent M28 family amino/carboxypeptidase